MSDGGNRMREEFEEQRSAGEVRINRYISECGVCSRREADRLIQAGKVTVDGQLAANGMLVTDDMEVAVDGRICRRSKKMVLLAFHKPEGVVCTTDRRFGDLTVEDVIQYPVRVFTVGRLDKDSEGLLLVTNNGDILNKIMRAGYYHEKEYVVTVERPVTEEFLETLRAGGIPVLDAVTRPCKAWRTGRRQFHIILTQGLNRQIRRMCEFCGFRVKRLVRIRIMNICLGDLPKGRYRNVTDAEMKELYEQLV